MKKTKNAVTHVKIGTLFSGRLQIGALNQVYTSHHIVNEIKITDFTFSKLRDVTIAHF